MVGSSFVLTEVKLRSIEMKYVQKNKFGVDFYHFIEILHTFLDLKQKNSSKLTENKIYTKSTY